MFDVKFHLVENVKVGVKVDKEGELVNTVSFETPLDVKGLARFLYLIRSNQAVTCSFTTPQLMMDLLIQEIEHPVGKENSSTSSGLENKAHTPIKTKNEGTATPPKDEAKKEESPTQTKDEKKVDNKQPVAAG